MGNTYLCVYLVWFANVSVILYIYIVKYKEEEKKLFVNIKFFFSYMGK